MWHFLAIIGILHAIMCYIIYSKQIDDKIWYMPLALFVAFLNNIIWFYSFKIIEGRKDAYIFSALQSVVLTTIYFLLPIVLFDLKLNKFEILGIMLIIAGISFIKFCQN